MTVRVCTATIGRVIDGDTIVMSEMRLGWGVSITDDPRRQTTHVRLAGVNTPDTRLGAKWFDPVLAKAATEYVNSTWPPGTPVVLTSYELDSFGRSLAKVEAFGADIGDVLVSLGYARTTDYAPPIAEG